MKEKIKYGLITLLIVISSNLYGQHGFLASIHSYQIEGNELRLFLQAEFSIGYGICDFLDTCFININNDTILINAVYDITGFNPQAGCTDYDTVNYNIANGNYTLVINSDIVVADSNSIDTVTVNASVQLFPNLTVAINEEFFVSHIKLYPNPAKDILQIEATENFQIERIELFDIGGKKVKEFSKNELTLNISGFNSGIYFIKLTGMEGVLTKKIVIE